MRIYLFNAGTRFSQFPRSRMDSHGPMVLDVLRRPLRPLRWDLRHTRQVRCQRAARAPNSVDPIGPTRFHTAIVGRSKQCENSVGLPYGVAGRSLVTLSELLSPNGFCRTRSGPTRLPLYSAYCSQSVCSRHLEVWVVV